VHRASLLAFLLVLSGCASAGRCGLEGCAGDHEITARVRALLDQHAALGAPNVVSVQTLDRVVYLKGLVDTPYQKRLAADVAGQAPGVRRIVNMIGVDNGPR
jgi:osmotically-inducible protein OsmY